MWFSLYSDRPGRTHMWLPSLVRQWASSYANELTINPPPVAHSVSLAPTSSFSRILIGDPLFKIQQKLGQLVELCREYQQGVPEYMGRIAAQFCQNFIRPAKDPTVLSGDFGDENTMMTSAVEGHRTLLIITLLYSKHMLASYYGRLDTAERISSKLKKQMRGGPTTSPGFAIIHTFHEGLVAAARGRHDKKPNLRLARKRLRSLRATVLLCPENFMHKAHLLEAEILVGEGRLDDAMCSYDRGMCSSCRIFIRRANDLELPDLYFSLVHSYQVRQQERFCERRGLGE